MPQSPEPKLEVLPIPDVSRPSRWLTVRGSVRLVIGLPQAMPDRRSGRIGLTAVGASTSRARTAGDIVAVGDYDRFPMPLTAIVVHVTRPGRRANELLAAVAAQLGRETPIADERGHVRILLEESEGTASQRVNDALDAASGDWHEYLHVAPRHG